MPVEFALRARIHLREGFEKPRRSRFRLPKFTLPVLAYWGVAAAITYQLLHWHDHPEVSSEARLAAFVPSEPARSWKQTPVTAPTFEAVPAPAVRAQPPEEPALPPSEEEPVADAPASSEQSLGADSRLASNDVADSRALRRERQPNDALFGVAPERRTRRRKLGLHDFHEARSNDVEAPPQRSVSHESIPAPDLFSLSPLAPNAPSHDAAPPLLGATPPDAPSAVANALPSCEAAAASANQEVNLAERDNTPDLSREAIAQVLDNGVWIARCDIPLNTSVDLCVAIQRGKVIGVSVSARPASAAINACVKRRAAGLSFPFSARVDVAHTHF
ncbi:MAG TPA: hypothetical protein VGM44_21150 [Polyangiaceae bacterium]|jgi:hypothetical protein